MPAHMVALLPIEHLAACGNYIPQGSYSRSPEREAQRAAELILPFIISIAAPSIRSLTIFGFISQVTREVDGRRVENIVESSVRFPKLQWLVLLDQNIIRPYHGQVGYRFPRLTSLYTDRDCIGHDLLALDTLREFRLDMLRSSYKTSVSFLQDLRVETFIIDATPHHYFWGGTQSMHQEWVESFHEFVKASSSSSESSVIVAKATCIRPKLVLGAWGDIVQGGSGYWKKGWRPTTAYGTRIEEFEVERLLVIKLTVRCTLFCSILNIIMSYGASPDRTPRCPPWSSTPLASGACSSPRPAGSPSASCPVSMSSAQRSTLPWTSSKVCSGRW